MESSVPLPIFTPDTATWCGRLKSWCLVSHQNHPKARGYFFSISAINKERKRQCRHANWWIIHPFSRVRFIWEIIMTLVYAVSFLVIPFMTSFIVFDYDAVRLDKISIALYAIFWLDILVNCVTGVFVRGNTAVFFSQAVIVKNYAKRFLILDVATSLPYDHMTYHWRTIPGPNTSLPITLINITPILKIFRYCTFHSYMLQLLKHSQFKDCTYRTASTLILSFYVVYWFACFCYLTPVIVMHIQQVGVTDCSCWLAKIHESRRGIPARFHQALFIVVQNFVASGFGAIEPESEGHTIICTVLMILGRIFEAYIIIMFVQIQSDKGAAQSKYEETMNQIAAYTRQKQLPPAMKRRLESYYFYRFRNTYFREKKILASLTSRLREEITLHSCRRLVENAAVFKDLPSDTIAAIVSTLKYELYLPNDIIVKAGTQGDCMYFLSSGTVAVFTPTGQEICHLEDGAHFGEVALLAQDQRRVGTVVAIEVCEVYRLERRNFRKCVAGHVDLFERIERIASERLDTTTMIQELQQRFPMNQRNSNFV